MKKGFSLIEVVLVLSVTIALLSTATYLYLKSHKSERVNNEVKNFSVLTEGLTNLYKTSTIPANSEFDEIAIKAKVVPTVMLSKTKNKIINGWKGDVHIGSYYIDSSKYPILAVQYNNVPAEECAQFVMQTARYAKQVVVGLAKTSDPGGIVRNGAGRNVVFGTTREDLTKKEDLTLANVTAACNMSANALILYKF